MFEQVANPDRPRLRCVTPRRSRWRCPRSERTARQHHTKPVFGVWRSMASRPAARRTLSAARRVRRERPVGVVTTAAASRRSRNAHEGDGAHSRKRRSTISLRRRAVASPSRRTSIAPFSSCRRAFAQPRHRSGRALRRLRRSCSTHAIALLSRCSRPRPPPPPNGQRRSPRANA